jgi:hypothetical protein
MPTERLRVYFTVDTETSMGGAWRNAEYAPLPTESTIFGKVGSEFYGIPLIMEILERYEFAATFFVEVFCAHVLGFEEVARVFRSIMDRGHDVQLHLHPVYRFYRDYLQGGRRREQDLIFTFPFEEQRELIADGVALFKQFTGRQPIAFRAGCYGASELTLKALSQNGILLDSSYNLCYLGQTCGFQERPLNAPRMIESVYEFPVTNFSSRIGEGYKALEISAVSVPEILGTIRELQEAGCRDVVLVFHSFSFLKRRGVRFENRCPDQIVIHRFQQLCAALSRMEDQIEVAVFGNINLAQIPCPQPQSVPSMGWIRPAMRKATQGLNTIPWI